MEEPALILVGVGLGTVAAFENKTILHKNVAFFDINKVT